MSPFDGKWKRVSAENVDAIVSIIAGSDSAKASSLKAYLETVELVEEYHVTDKETTRKIYVNGELKRDQKNPFGVEIDSETLLGKTKIFVTKRSESVIEVIEKASNGQRALAIFAIEGNKMKLTYTMNSVTCTRIYEKC